VANPARSFCDASVTRLFPRLPGARVTLRKKIVWAIAITAVFSALSVWRYRRAVMH
jgi:hypothetical protein